MRFVVTGTGRSGTGWAADVLGVGHQAMFTGDGFVESDAAGDVSFWAASQNLEGWRVVLLVRDPRLVVASWLNTGEFHAMIAAGHYRMWQHCNRIDPAITTEYDVYRRAERYWYAVNYRMAQRADAILRVEDCTPEALGDACGEVPFRDVAPPESETKPLGGMEDPDAQVLAEDFGYDWRTL